MFLFSWKKETKETEKKIKIIICLSFILFLIQLDLCACIVISKNTPLCSRIIIIEKNANYKTVDMKRTMGQNGLESWKLVYDFTDWFFFTLFSVLSLISLNWMNCDLTLKFLGGTGFFLGNSKLILTFSMSRRQFRFFRRKWLASTSTFWDC